MDWERAWTREPPPTLDADTGLVWRLQAQNAARVWSEAQPRDGQVDLTETELRRWLYVRWLHRERHVYSEMLS